MTDKEKFIEQAEKYIGRNGYYVCIQKLKLGFVVDWCAYAVSSIMNDCGFIGKYIKEIEGGAGSIPRNSDGKYGEWFKKGRKKPQKGDLFFLRYYDYPEQDKYFCDHVGIVKEVKGDSIITSEGNVDGQSINWAETSAFWHKTRNLNDSCVYAFYRPAWADDNNIRTRTAGNIYNKDWKDPLGNASKVLGHFPDNSSVKFIKDVGYGWSKINYRGVTGYAMNIHFLKKYTLSAFPKKALTKRTKALTFVNKRNVGKATLNKGDIVDVVSEIESGTYKGYQFVKNGKQKFYIKGGG